MARKMVKTEKHIVNCMEIKMTPIVMVLDAWICNQWPTFTSQFSFDDIWNANETTLHYRALPEYSYVLKNEKVKGVCAV